MGIHGIENISGGDVAHFSDNLADAMSNDIDPDDVDNEHLVDDTNVSAEDDPIPDVLPEAPPGGFYGETGDEPEQTEGDFA